MINWIKKIFLFKKKSNQEEPLTDGQLLILRREYKRFKEKALEQSNRVNKIRQELKEEHNNICPKCKSTNVTDRIKRFEGEINGRSHGNYWSALSFGSGSSSGYINGKFDTNEVNKCNDCENEWKKHAGLSYWGSSDVIDEGLVNC